MLFKKRKVNPFTKNETLTLIISSLALLFSLVQLLFTVPFFANKIYAPNIVCKLDSREFKTGNFFMTYLLKNEGNKTAENVIIGFTCFKHNYIISPGVNFTVEEKENGVPLKDIIIKTESFAPGEHAYIIIYGDSATYQKEELKEYIPFFQQIKYKDGFVNKVESRIIPITKI